MARSLLFLSLLLFACNNLEDATIPERQTFIRFFGSPQSYTAVVAELDTDGGFILAGNAAPLNTETATDAQRLSAIIIVKTDKQGTKLWEKSIPNANVRSIKPLADGYLVTGEGIELNPTSTESSEFVNTSFLLLKLNTSGEIAQQYTKDSSIQVTRGTNQVTLKVDFRASASAIINGGTEVATLGSFKVPGSQERTITLGFATSNISAPIWRKNLDLVNFDYINTNSLTYQQTGNLVWASTATPIDVNQSKYLSVIAAPPNYASPSNNSLFGKNEEGAHDVKDFQPSSTGFAAIGTYTNKAGNKNAFYVKADPAGNIMASTARYFDGIGNAETGVLTIEKTAAGITQDEGNAITFTRDGGFVLACSMQQHPDKGNGGTDVLLIKIDAFGNYKWDKLLGGSGNEVASSIRELSDGTLLIAGTSTISNVSSMFVIRADGNGNLKE